jgi:hypothetical protein
MLRKIFGHYISFIIWHAYVGGGVGFLIAALTNNVGWQEFCRPVPTFWVLFVIGCFIGWFHHDKSSEVK